MDVSNTGVIKSSLKIRCFSAMRSETIMTENQKLTFLTGPWELRDCRN